MDDKDDNLSFILVAGAFAFIVFILAMTLLGGWAAIFGREVGKYNEESRRQIYEESATYNQGMAVDLDNLCRQWRAAKTADEKAGLADTINLRSASYTGKLPKHVTACLKKVR